jgi:xanthine dehydrogenase accessory factor
MVCGGKALVLLDYIDAGTSNTQLFRDWQESLDKGKGFYYLVQIEGENSSLRTAERSLLMHDGMFSGDIKLSKKQFETLRNEVCNISSTTIISLDNSRFVVDPIKRLQTLYLIGAGHVAVPTAQIAAMVGFQVIVVDDRSEFANKERFPDAECIKIIKEYKQVFSGFDLDDEAYIVIMTRGHTYDRVALEQALKTTACYIGMISSRQKRESVFQTLLAKGATRQQLERVHSPIGIDIGSETPEEIAVSIVAELIKVRSGLEA